MLDKMINQMNKELNAFLGEFELDYQARMGQEFMCLLDENVIEWSLLYVDSAGEAFRKNFIKRFPLAENLSLFTLSFLHELGHLETEWEMIDDVAARNSAEMDNESYFNLHNEWIATEWAGEWISANEQKARNLDNKILKIIQDFYEKVLDK